MYFGKNMQKFSVLEGFFDNVYVALYPEGPYLTPYDNFEDYKSSTSKDLGKRAPAVINPFGTTKEVLERLGNYDNFLAGEWYYKQGLWDGRVFSAEPIVKLFMK